MKNFIILLISCVVVISCQSQKTVRVEPESLLNSSSEHVSFGLVDSASVDSIIDWIRDDKPAHAELSCSTNTDRCEDAKIALARSGVSFSNAASPNGSDSVTLIYDRIAARSCNNRGFGCSVSVNTIQMVTDHNYFIRPPLSDLQDAEKAVEVYDRYVSE